MGRTVQIEHAGRTQSLAAWARECGVSAASLRYRLNAGWAMEKALQTPRWQGINSRSRRIMYNWRIQTMTAWARELGISLHALNWRINHCSLDRALSQSDHSGSDQ
jgi:hypothetical protein